MVDVNELRGIIAKNGLSQSDVAKKLGITPKTFYEKMKKAIFTSKEMHDMIKYLKIEDPCLIFFVDDVAQKATK